MPANGFIPQEQRLSPSKSVVAKNRWHRGCSAAFRRAMRRVGVSFDEEQAQFALAGIPTLLGEGDEFLSQVRTEVIASRHELMREWEQANPNRNPYPPSFPERVASMVRAVREGVDAEGMISADGMVTLVRLDAICKAECRSDPFGPPDDFDPFAL